MSDIKKLKNALQLTILDLRARENLSQEKFAKRCGLTRQYICRLEDGKQMPRLDTVAKILEALGMTFAEFGADFDRALESQGKKSAVRTAAEQKGPFWG